MYYTDFRYVTRNYTDLTKTVMANEYIGQIIIIYYKYIL